MTRCTPGILLAAGLLACADSPGPEWAGTIDTLPGGVVRVQNPATGAWGEGQRWEVVEELRLGREDGEGPEVFGRIGMLAEDHGGRVWVFETTEQQFKVFDRAGRFIRTVGRRGGGPGEMQRAGGIVAMPDGRMIVVDLPAARITAFDTAGNYLHSYRINAGFTLIPWPGRLDREGRLYNALGVVRDGRFEVAMIRYDTAMTPVDTLQPPRGGPREVFEHRRGDNVIQATVPFTPTLQWQLGPAGDFWSLHTGTYELIRHDGRGDTLRVVSKPFERVLVTAEEKDSAMAALKWFAEEGGTLDRGRIPDIKPAARGFQVADDGHLWVNVISADTSQANRVFEVLDPEGRFLGQVHLPFRMLPSPRPLLRDDWILAVTEDSLGVPYVVRARIMKH